jgi:ABC-type sulfate/molybdate transport systems ATPase subunit
VRREVSRRVPGSAVRRVSVAGPVRSVLLREVGRLLARMHAASIGELLAEDGLFPVDGDGVALGARLEAGFADPADLIGQRPDSWPLAVTPGEVAARARAMVPASFTPVVLHSNPGPTHVFVDGGGALCGVIDFGDSYVSHPAMDLRAWPDPADRVALREGYLGGRALGGAGITLGTLTAFVLLFSQFFTPLINLGDEWQSVQAALAGAERVFAVLALPTDQSTGQLAALPVPASPEGSQSGAPVIQIEKVSFGYTPGHPVLHDVSLTVHDGEHVAVVGRTGAGKSSLLALLAGLYTPWTGELVLAGRHPRAMRDPDRRSALGFVPQQVTLFSGTVHDNLTLGDTAIPADDVHQAALIAGADRFIEALPRGYDTVLSDTARGSGVQLSAGQRQLLALARALATRPAVLLLDEATAVIDGASDAAFRTALHDRVLPAGTAVLTIAHRLSTARDADRVLLMSAGRITEQGTPAQLLAADSTFAALNALEQAGWDWQHDTDTHD